MTINMELVRLQGYMRNRNYKPYRPGSTQNSERNMFQPTIKEIFNDSKATIEKVQGNYRKSKK